MPGELEGLIPPKEERVTTGSRQKMVIEYRRMIVAQKYLRGQSMGKIAQEMPAELSCTRQTVYNDIKVLRDQWRQEANLPIADLRAKELAKIDELERVAWESFEISKGDKIVSKFGTVLPAAAGSKPTVAAGPIRTVTKSQAGNPKWLDIIDKCVNRRCEILGIKKQQNLDPHSDLPVLGLVFLRKNMPGDIKQIESTQSNAGVDQDEDIDDEEASS